MHWTKAPTTFHYSLLVVQFRDLFTTSHYLRSGDRQESYLKCENVSVLGSLRVTFPLPIPSPSSQKNDPWAVPLSLRATISPRGFFRLKPKEIERVRADRFRMSSIYTLIHWHLCWGGSTWSHCCWDRNTLWFLLSVFNILIFLHDIHIDDIGQICLHRLETVLDTAAYGRFTLHIKDADITADVCTYLYAVVFSGFCQGKMYPPRTCRLIWSMGVGMLSICLRTPISLAWWKQ